MNNIGKKTILCFLCLSIFLFGIGIGLFLERLSIQAQRQFIENTIYLSDTQEKIDQWFQNVEKDLIDLEVSQIISDEEQTELFVDFKKFVPIAVVDKIGIFYNRDADGYLLCEVGLHKPIAEFAVTAKYNVQEYRRHDSRVLEGSIIPHATINFYYINEGSYVKGGFFVNNRDSTLNRIYIDSNGDDLFDTMHVNDNGNRVIYKMAGMTWIKKDENILNDLRLQEGVDETQLKNERGHWWVCKSLCGLGGSPPVDIVIVPLGESAIGKSRTPTDVMFHKKIAHSNIRIPHKFLHTRCGSGSVRL